MRKTITTLTLAATAMLAAAAQAEVIAITGGTVHTLGERGTLEDATVLVREGRIAELGTEVAIPEEATRIDATGKIVTPGVIDAHGQIGIVEISGVEQTVDSASGERRFTAAFDVADAVNPRSVVIPVNRIEGITRAVVAPTHHGDGTLIAGRGAIIDLIHPSDFITHSPAAMYASLGESGARLSGGARGAAFLHLREAFEDARDFAENRAAFEQRDRRDYALSRLDLEALQPVIDGELPLVLRAHRASDIRAALRLAEEYGLRLVIRGGAEAWMVAEALAAAEVPVLIDPLQNRPGSFESLGATLENAARLHEAGVDFAFASGRSQNARNITQAAGNAVAHGLPWAAALEAITAAPARIWGIDDRLGRLEPGMEADLVVWDGDPLEVTSYADHVLIRGMTVPMESRHTRLRDRYRDLGEGELPRAYPREWRVETSQAPVGDSGVTVTTSITLRGDDRIGVSRYGEPQRRPEALVLYLPGMHMNGRAAVTDERYNVWLYLARRGIAVYALDYRSHFVAPDAEALEPLRDWTLERYVDDALHVLETLRQEHPELPVFVMGFSRGVTLAYGLACRAAEHDLAGLIALDGGFKRPPEASGARFDYDAALAEWRESQHWAVDIAGSRGWEGRQALMHRAIENEPGAHEELAEVLYNAWGPGRLANPGTLSDVSVLARLLAGYDRYYPSIQGLEGRAIALTGNAPHTAIDDCWGEMTLPILAFDAERFGAGADIAYSAEASGSEAVEIVELEGYGHLDVLVGNDAAGDVFEPALDWIREQAGLTPP